ncbi:hypothetical protein [Stenotrophomonas maltophilia]|uniref:hypothetical protein n=1 Tax=Stenotrophomonas maltophilia TaxID=40324 RepID=UPI000DA854EC|nr:hypothetical protein [Stenotrophomonas maltophilia]
MHRQEDWKLQVRGHDLTVRVVLDGIGRFGQGTMIGFHMLYGPSRLGLDIRVESKQDAAAKIEAFLAQLMGEHW